MFELVLVQQSFSAGPISAEGIFTNVIRDKTLFVGTQLSQNLMSMKKSILILLPVILLIAIIIGYFSSSVFKISTPSQKLTQKAESQIPVISAPQKDVIFGLPHVEKKPFELIYPNTPRREGFVVRVSQDPHYRGSFPEDHFVLKIFPVGAETKPQIIHRFLSSYMEFDLKLVDLTGDGLEEFILITGEGRGTEVREETLTVFRRLKFKLVPLLRIPFSGYYGMSQWNTILSFPKK